MFPNGHGASTYLEITMRLNSNPLATSELPTPWNIVESASSAYLVGPNGTLLRVSTEAGQPAVTDDQRAKAHNFALILNARASDAIGSSSGIDQLLALASQHGLALTH